MSATEFTTERGGSWEWFAEKSANVVRFLAPVIEANQTRRDLPKDVQEALDFFLSIALSDGLRMLAWVGGRDLTGRELTQYLKFLRDHGEAGFDEVYRRLSSPHQPSADFHFELLVGMRALIDDGAAIDLPLIDEWLCNFDWRDPLIQGLRDLTCRVRAGEIGLEHYLLSVRLELDALELETTNPDPTDVPENLFLAAR